MEIMPKISYRKTGELIALLGVILSLTFVGLELRQSTIASKAAAYQQLGVATANTWFLVVNNIELNNIIVKLQSGEIESFNDLSESEKNMLISFTVGNLRLYETVYLQVEQGLLDESALKSLGWEGYGNTAIKPMWPIIQDMITPSFASYLEDSWATKK